MTRNRLRVIAVGLGAVTGGLLLAAVSQLALAPSAQAQPDDPFVDVFVDIQNNITAGQADFSDAATYFADGNLLDALTLDLVGTANAVFGSGLDLTVDGTEALTGNPESGPFEFIGFQIPAGLDQGVDFAQQDFSAGLESFDSALTLLSAGDVTDGLASAAYGAGDVLVYAPNDILLGLADSLLAGGVA